MAHNFKDEVWPITPEPNGNVTLNRVSLCILMDLRDELKAIRLLLEYVRQNTSPLQCSNALRIPAILDKIAANTQKPKRKKKKVTKP